MKPRRVIRGRPFATTSPFTVMVIASVMALLRHLGRRHRTRLDRICDQVGCGGAVLKLVRPFRDRALCGCLQCWRRAVRQTRTQLPRRGHWYRPCCWICDCSGTARRRGRRSNNQRWPCNAARWYRQAHQNQTFRIVYGLEGAHALSWLPPRADLRNDGRAEPESRAQQCGACNLAHADQDHAMTWRHADRVVGPGPNEFCLAARKQQHLRPWHDILVKPRRARIGANDCDTVGVIEKSDQPWHVTVAPTERWVHEDQPPRQPWLLQTILFDGEARFCRNEAFIETG